MKPNMEACKKLAESIAVELYEAHLCDELESVESFAASKIADMLVEHDKELLNRAHMAYIEAVKREGDK